MTQSESQVQRGWQFVTNHVAALLALAVLLWLSYDLVVKLLSPTSGVSAGLVLTFVWQGLVIGLVYGLAGIGLSMTYSILNFANFAHGDYITTGAFGGWAATFVVAGFGSYELGNLILVGAGRVFGSASPGNLAITITSAPFSIFVGLVVSALVTVVLALVLDRIVYKPMRNQDGIALLIASVGVAFALRNLLQFVFGESVLTVAAQPGKLQIPIGAEVVNVSYHQAVLVVSAIVLMLAVHFVLQYTRLGKAMRAMADNKDLARVTGIPTERVVLFTWIIGAALAGMAGFLLTLESGNLIYTRGWRLLLFIFAAVILGGIGSIYGAIAGGVIIGLTEKLSLIWLGGDLSDLATAVAFGLMVLILLYRPEGLFSGRTTA
ncbi:branched-chain amino acid ABC transporter permease [Haloarchaeobius sp. HRN-SO-5]|uniref:branched-chain amino acid ABC transporter permease n=1 Tax=Haloarchaeobius sp. HRN-SO-5 TaxID=3446118 RepID=UPI003EB7E728